MLTRAVAFALCIVGLFFVPLSAATLDVPPGAAHFDRISRSDGLSNASVSSIVQDRQGFIWFGTQGGLNRYDGRDVRVFEHDPFDSQSLPHNLIQTMYLDPTVDCIWIGTYRGLSRFDIFTEEFTNYRHAESRPDTLSDDVVTAIIRGRSETLWIGTLDGLNRLDTTTESISRIDGLPHQTVRSLHLDSAERLWVGTYGGLAELDPGTGDVLRVVTAAEGLASNYVMDIHETDPGTLWLALWDGGIARFDVDTGSVENVSLVDNRVYVLNGRENLFAGTWGGGLFRYKPASGHIDRFVHSGDSQHSLSHNVVYSLMFDDAGVLWIGTNGNGVNRFDDDKRDYVRFQHDPEDPGSLSAGKVTAIRRDSAGVLWIGTYTGGLNRYDPIADRMVRYRHDPDDPHSLSNDIVTSIFEDSRANLWITTNDGLNRYDRQADRFDRIYHDPDDPDSLSDNITYSMAEDSDGRLWVGTYSAGVSRWDPADGAFVHYRNEPGDPTSLSDDLVYTLLYDSRGRLWVGTNNGLNRYDPEIDGFVRYLHDPDDRTSPSSNTIRALHEGSDGRLWIGTVSGGLNSFDPESGAFSHLTKHDGLPDNTVVGILPDERERLWLATNYGISVVDPAGSVIRNLDTDDGLAGMEFNSGHFRDTDGSLIFGGPHGVSVFSGEVLQENTHAPPVHLVSILAGSETISPVGENSAVELSYDNASVFFEFVALDFEAPLKNTYRYKLMGFDEEWTASGTRNFAGYTNLPPGDYTFVVQGANNDGVWGRVPATSQISVSAPPWLRWWAFLGYGLFFVLVYAVAVRIREGRILRARVQELTETRERLQQANQRLAALSVEDGLTGVYNRRYLDARIEEEVSRAERSGAPLALLIVDIDRFKAYNDAYGHTSGDQSLKHVAGALDGAVNRVADCVARYGGEEFCILLPQTEIDGAQAVATRVMKAIADLAIRHEASDIAEHLTVSVGICAWTPKSGMKPDELLAAADTALYRAKAAGRNRIELC